MSHLGSVQEGTVSSWTGLRKCHWPLGQEVRGRLHLSCALMVPQSAKMGRHVVCWPVEDMAVVLFKMYALCLIFTFLSYISWYPSYIGRVIVLKIKVFFKTLFVTKSIEN